jgi:hypothetical protein
MLVVPQFLQGRVPMNARFAVTLVLSLFATEGGAQGAPEIGSGLAPTSPTPISCGELAEFHLNPKSQNKLSFFGKPFAEYTKTDLVLLMSRAARCQKEVSDVEARFFIQRAKDRIGSLHRSLEQARAEAGKPFDPLSDISGQPACSDIAAFGSSVRPNDYEERVRASFFGKPLSQYSKPELARIYALATQCHTGYEGKEEVRSLMFAEQRLRGVQDLHAADLRQAEQDEAQEKRASEKEKAASAQAGADETQRRLLRSGQRKVSDMRDAMLLHNAKNAFGIMRAPLLRPDGEIYGHVIKLESQRRDNVIVGRFNFSQQEIANAQLLARMTALARASNRSAASEQTYLTGQEVLQSVEATYYVILRTTKSTKILAPQKMRVGEEVLFIGKYIANENHSSPARASGTVPVIEVLYLGEVPRAP